MKVIYREHITERQGEYVKMILKPMRWRDWLTVVWHWSQITWRTGQGGTRIDSHTAWRVAKIIVGVVRDVELWKAGIKACGRTFNGE